MPDLLRDFGAAVQSVKETKQVKFHKKSILRGLAIGMLVTLLVMGPISFIDWRQNPGGIFRDSTGTNWETVFETLYSWL